MGLTKNGRKIFGSLFTSRDGNCSNVYIGSLSLVNQLGEVASTVLTQKSSGDYVVDNVGYYITSLCDINTLITGYDSGHVYRLGICLGSGNDTESPDDYTLTSCGLTGKSIAITKGTESTMIQGSVTAYNNTDSDITVREIGLGLWGVPSESGMTGENCLLYRKVLPSPVVVKPDETYTFTLVLK